MIGQNYHQDPMKTNSTERSKSKQALVIAGILMALLVLLNVVIFLRGNSKVKEAESVAAEREAAAKLLQTQLDVATARLDSLEQLFPAKEEQIEALKRQLEERSATISNNINTGSSAGLSKARAQIEKLTRVNESLNAQLAEMTTQNTQLKADVEAMSAELQRISAELNTTKEENAELQRKLEGKSSGGNTTSTNTDNGGKNNGNTTDNSADTDANASLGAGGVQITSLEVSKKDPNKTRPTSDAKKTGKLNICFTITPNPKVGNGDQTFQFQVIKPDQTTIGSLMGEDKDSGAAFKYTSEETSNYDGSAAQVCSSINSKDFSKGSYTVNVWHRGHKIGTGSFKLK
jgi:TolA-binding protein